MKNVYRLYGQSLDCLQHCLQILKRCQALDEFIALKERQTNRLIHINDNLNAILEIEWLNDYILTFPNRDQSGTTMLLFWPEEIKCQRKNRPKGRGAQASTKLGTANEQRKPHVDPLAHLPDVQPRGYFGPSQSALSRTGGASIGHARPHVRGWEELPWPLWYLKM